MTFWVLLIMGLFVLLMILLFEVYLTLRLNHDIAEDIDRIVDDIDYLMQEHADMDNRLCRLERKIIAYETEDDDNGRISVGDIEYERPEESCMGSGEATV